jgi:hypothetical protein
MTAFCIGIKNTLSGFVINKYSHFVTGPQISNALVNAGIVTFQKLEETNPREIEMVSKHVNLSKTLYILSHPFGIFMIPACWPISRFQKKNQMCFLFPYYFIILLVTELE